MQKTDVLFRTCSRIKYKISIAEGDTVIIFAPHPDDETIGCGGLMFQLLKKNCKIVIILFTPSQKDKNYAKRWSEFCNAMKHYKKCKIECLFFEDGKLTFFYDEIKEDIKKILKRENPDFIFTPYIMDAHPDHICVNEVLAEIIPTEDIDIIMYEVWVPILHPNYYVDISHEWDDKKSTLQCYQSQINKYSIIDKVETLNKLRAQLSMRNKVKYVECYKKISVAEYVQAVTTLKCAKTV